MHSTQYVEVGSIPRLFKIRSLCLGTVLVLALRHGLPPWNHRLLGVSLWLALLKQYIGLQSASSGI
jgi:hypothetical protein